MNFGAFGLMVITWATTEFSLCGKNLLQTIANRLRQILFVGKFVWPLELRPLQNVQTSKIFAAFRKCIASIVRVARYN